MSGSRFAAIDLGTNTVLLLIAELNRDGSFAVLEDHAEITRLGEGVDRTGRIGTAGEERSLAVLQRYVERCHLLGVAEIAMVGTSALREAENGNELLQRFRQELGVGIRVLSGEEEAAYCHLAVQRGLDLGGQDSLVVDVGGGSTEFIWGKGNHVFRLVSLNLGAVRLTERFIHSDPVEITETEAMMQVIDRELRSLLKRWGKEACGLMMVGIAGTFTTLAAIEKRLARYSHSDVHGSILTLNEVKRQVKLFQGMAVEERKAIPGLEPKRADVILAGAQLIESIMSRFQVPQVIVSDQGVRYGLLHERLGRGMR